MTDTIPADAGIRVNTGAGLRIGTAPPTRGACGSPDDPNQVPWQRFLDEVVASGYT